MKRAALFVGINRYEDSQIGNHEYAESDATELYAFFKHRAGYEDVRHLLSPDSDELLNTAVDMVLPLTEDDFFMFFFAGHGVEYDGRHLLLCPKARHSRLKYHQHGLPLDLIKEETSVSGLHRVLVLDSCRSEVLKGQRGAESGMRNVQSVKKAVGGETGMKGSLAILCSCDEGRPAREMSELRRGLFTGALLKMLTEAQEKENELVLGHEFESEIERHMSEMAKECRIEIYQRPWIQRSGTVPPLLVGRSIEEKMQVGGIVGNTAESPPRQSGPGSVSGSNATSASPPVLATQVKVPSQPQKPDQPTRSPAGTVREDVFATLDEMDLQIIGYTGGGNCIADTNSRAVWNCLYSQHHGSEIDELAALLQVETKDVMLAKIVTLLRYSLASPNGRSHAEKVIRIVVQRCTFKGECKRCGLQRRKLQACPLCPLGVLDRESVIWLLCATTAQEVMAMNKSTLCSECSLAAQNSYSYPAIGDFNTGGIA